MSRFEIDDLPIPGLRLIKRKKIEDERGSFERVFCDEEFSMGDIVIAPVQINHSFTKRRGTIRGLHFQTPPYAEIKVVTCLIGAVWDVVVDLRKNSSTFMQWHCEELSENNDRAIYIPEGFAHGFQAITDNVHLLYLHSEKYNPKSEKGLNPLDQKLNIRWPIFEKIISERDLSHKMLECGDLYAL